VRSHPWGDDDELLAVLGRALRAAPAVPRELVEAGKAAWTWRDVDAELAALAHDSALDDELVAAATRAEPAPLRTMTFRSPELTIEVEVTEDALLGQFVPPQPGRVEVVVERGGDPTVPRGGDLTVPVDEVGYFVVRPIPSGRFRLHCRTAERTSVLTDWTTL